MTCGIWGIDESNVGCVALQTTALPPELIPRVAGMTGLEPAIWTLTVSRDSIFSTSPFWWAVRGTIPRPCACKAPALPTELTARFCHFVCRRSLSTLPGTDPAEVYDNAVPGSRGIRTLGLCRAKAALSQLSYTPIWSLDPGLNRGPLQYQCSATTSCAI